MTVIPNGIDPRDLVAVDDLDALRARFAAPGEKLVLLIGRLVYEKGFQVALDALPRVIRRVGGVRFLVAGSGTHEAELKRQARRARADGARHVHGLDRRRRPALAVPDRRPLRGAVDLRAVRPRRAGGDGQRLPVHRGRHGRPARGRADLRRRAALPLARPALARADDGARPHRRGAARPARGRGLRARPALRLGRRGPADARASTRSWRPRPRPPRPAERRRQPASRSMPSATVRRTTARLSRLRSNSRGV